MNGRRLPSALSTKRSVLNSKPTLCANPIALAPTASNCPRRPRWRRVCVGAGSERSDGSDESDGSGRSGGVASRHGGFPIRWPCVDYAYHQRCAHRPCYAYRPSSSGPTSPARQAPPPRQRIRLLFCGAWHITLQFEDEAYVGVIRARELATVTNGPKKEGLWKGSARRWAAIAARHYTFGGFGKPGLGQLSLILARKTKSSILAC